MKCHSVTLQGNVKSFMLLGRCAAGVMRGTSGSLKPSLGNNCLLCLENEMKFRIKRKLVATNSEHHTKAQPPYWAASYSLISRAKTPVSFEYVKCTTPMTFSQKLYQSHASEVVEEFGKALGVNSLESLKNLLERCLR